MALIQKSTQRTAIIIICVALAMLGISFASVPLYQAFCQLVGYGGTVKIAAQDLPEKSPAEYGMIKVRFDSNVNGGLPWEFQQEETEIEIEIGEITLAYYQAKNLADYDTIAQAGFNVTPHIAGKYFVKIDCFCFTEQKLKPDESRRMAVNFYIDSAITEDQELQNLDAITLSYTFFSLYEPPSDDEQSHQHGDSHLQ